MKLIQTKVIKHQDAKTPLSESQLMADLLRTKLQGETDNEHHEYASEKQMEPTTVPKSDIRKSFEKFWEQFHHCSDGEKLKYQQGLVDGTYILNQIEIYAQKKTGFNPEKACQYDDDIVPAYQAFKKNYQFESFAYQRNDKGWGGLCIIENVKTKEWVIAVTQVEFKDKELQAKVSILGRGELFEHIKKTEPKPNIKDTEPSLLYEILDNNRALA